MKPKQKREFIKIGKYIHEVIVVKDQAGNLLHKIVKPLRVEFYPRDIMQVIVGASILAIPVSLTEETWRLGETLPYQNTLAISLLSVLFMGLFVYYNNYRGILRTHKNAFIKRVLTTYILALGVSILFLTLLDKASLINTFIISLKRAVIVALPASMSAAVADTLK